MRVAVWVLAWVVAMSALAATPAHADEASRRAAGKAFAAGQAADGKKDYRGAIEHYLRAYELEPHPNALYNIGIDYERLGEYREAAAWFQRYLREAPDSPELDRVQRMLVELKLKPSQLTVKTNVPGVRVFVDGQYAGSTPFTKPVRGGGRRIAVELSGQKDEREIYLEYGEPKEIELALRTIKPAVGPTGTLVITGAPDGATITVDDQVVGSLPSVQVDVTPGVHVVAATRYGYQSWSTNATVEAGTQTPVTVLMVHGTDATPPGDARVIKLHYLIGVGGGAEVRGTGGGWLVTLGYGGSRFDLAGRYGRLGEFYLFDLIARGALTKAKVAPVLGLGFSYMGLRDGDATSPSAGFEVLGGIKWDFARGDVGTASLLVEASARFHSEIATDDMGGTRSGIVFPLFATIQYTYAGRR